ncbi:MAG: hypothetical protein ABIP63_04630 [Thermoanaerobaculia bacterium]
MNYDLAMMALEGLTRSRLRLSVEGDRVTLHGDASAFKDFARLCLLLGGASTADEAFELQPGVHLSGESPALHLRLE